MVLKLSTTRPIKWESLGKFKSHPSLEYVEVEVVVY